MTKKIPVVITDIQQAARDLISAHKAVGEGIATHAEKHRVATNQKREEAARNLRIAEGARRHNAEIPATGS